MCGFGATVSGLRARRRQSECVVVDVLPVMCVAPYTELRIPLKGTDSKVSLDSETGIP